MLSVYAKTQTLIIDKEQKEKIEMTKLIRVCSIPIVMLLDSIGKNLQLYAKCVNIFTTTDCLFLQLQQNLSLWQEDPITP